MSMQEVIEYIRIIRKRWWLVATVCGAAVGIILVSAWLAPAQYQGSVRFLVSVPPSGGVLLYPAFAEPSQAQQIAVTRSAFVEVLQSPPVVRQALEKLGLALNLRDVMGGVSVNQANDSEFVSVSARAGDPQEAADLANALMAAGREYFGQIQAASVASAREFISSQVQDAGQRLAAARQTLAAFKRENGISDLAAEIASERDLITSLKLSNSSATVTNNTSVATAYERLIIEHEQELQRLTALSDRYYALGDEIGEVQSYYKFLLDKETEAKLKENEALSVSYIQVVEPAYPALEPLPAVDIRVLALGLVTALIVSMALVFGLEYAETHRAPNPALGAEPLPKAANGD